MKINDIYEFKLGFFPHAYMFETDNYGIVIEKEKDIVCVYATSKTHSPVYCAIPLCHPKELKNQIIRIKAKTNLAFISLGEYKVVLDFEHYKATNNKNLMIYGSDTWGYENIQVEWNDLLNKAFEK